MEKSTEGPITNYAIKVAMWLGRNTKGLIIVGVIAFMGLIVSIIIMLTEERPERPILSSAACETALVSMKADGLNQERAKMLCSDEKIRLKLIKTRLNDRALVNILEASEAMRNELRIKESFAIMGDIIKVATEQTGCSETSCPIPKTTGAE